MKRGYLSCIVFGVFLLPIFGGNVIAQKNTAIDGMYSFGDFAMPDPVQAPKDYVKITSAFKDRYLVVEAEIERSWHLYSVTQPEGGTIRTEFLFKKNPDLIIEEIRPTTVPHVDKNVVGFDVPIESHADNVVWIVRFDKNIPTDVLLDGTLKGQVCQEGEGGSCIPITLPFSAKYDDKLDVPGFLANTKEVPKPFYFETEKSSDNTVTENKTDSKSPIDVHSVQDVNEVTKVAGIGTALLYAFLGGIILNFMPCVLPVIGLKIMSFFEQAGKSRAKAFWLNLWYSLGLLAVFLFLASLSVGLSKMFTFDLFNIVMAGIVFAMALSLMGIWELSVPGFLGGSSSDKLMRQEGVAGAFFKGIITTLLAIPCGAPLLSPAVNWADVQIRSGNTPLVFLVYGFIGLGMASPYLLIGAFPELLRFLPKPGNWMETFKHAMGYCLLVAVVWILYFVQFDLLLPTVAMLFALWFACWMIGRLEYTASSSQRVRAWIISLIVFGIVIFFSYNIKGVKNSYTLQAAMQERLARLMSKQETLKSQIEKALKAGRPVMIDFTADWCVNCKVLEATVLKSKPVQEKIDEKNVVSLVGDCTREGDAVQFLRTLGSEQVPVIALYDPKNPTQPSVLRGFYTQKSLLELLEKL